MSETLIISDFNIRGAVPEDAELIHSFICELAEYENALERVTSKPEDLKKWIFEEKTMEAVIGEARGEPVAFALFYTVYSAYAGKPVLYLADLYVSPETRGKGFGKALMAYLARLTQKRGYIWMEWTCMNWNKPSISFYLSLGARPQDDRTIYRLQGEDLQDVAMI